MYDDKIVMLLPALTGCPGRPACDPPHSLCGDHRDVYRAMRHAQEYEREFWMKQAEELVKFPYLLPTDIAPRAKDTLFLRDAMRRYFAAWKGSSSR